MRLPWPRKTESSEEAPNGVRLHMPDGRVVTCSVLRDADLDADGCAAWLAVPDEPVPLVLLEGMKMSADVLPAHTSLHFDIRGIVLLEAAA